MLTLNPRHCLFYFICYYDRDTFADYGIEHAIPQTTYLIENNYINHRRLL